MGLIFQAKDDVRLLVQAETLLPDTLAGLSAIEISHQPIPLGNRKAEVGEVFDVSETSSAPNSLVFEGDLRHVHGLGREMSTGAVVIHGDAGAYLGWRMTGGSIVVDGDASSYAGAEMHGGQITINGNAGDWLGASLPGSRLGMRDGVICVRGSVGLEVGRRMRRGLIAVGGDVGDFCGKRMVAGTIVTFGSVGRFPGSGMKRGTLGFMGADGWEPWLAFAGAGRFPMSWMSIYLKRLREWGMPVAPEVFSTGFERYNGDLVAGGKGEILVASSRKVS